VKVTLFFQWTSVVDRQHSPPLSPNRLGKPVYYAQNQRIGKIDDIIITPDNAVSFAILGIGGLGIGKHDVVIPVDHIHQNGKHVLPGAFFFFEK
jgi:hypothetical protein